MSFPIKRTTDRRYPLYLRAEYENRGPYYLVDLAGYGASWRKPAADHYPSPEMEGAYRRRPTWIPIFNRANLAFTLVNEDETVDAKTAKRIADKTYAKFEDGRSRPTSGQIEAYAWHLLHKERTRAKRDRSRRRRS